jgi:hypothetical protein
VTSESVEKIEAKVIIIIQDALRKGKITRDEAFVMLERIVRDVENEIAHATASSTQVLDPTSR